MDIFPLGNKKEFEDQEGFTLVELILSMVIMGMIIFVINVVLISVLKTSARTDTMIRLDNYIETSSEIIQRNAKSAEPSSLCIAQYNDMSETWECTKEVSGDALRMSLISELDTDVVFYFYEDEDGIGIIKSYWITDDGVADAVTNLTSGQEIDVETFQVDLALDNQTGVHRIILRTISDSIDRIGADDPLVNDMLRTTNIVTRGKEI